MQVVVASVMTEPLRPGDVATAKAVGMPDFVIEAVNHLISTLTGKSFSILQSDVVDEILRRAPKGTTRADVFDKHWLDFEPIYRAAGWRVTYDKPGYCEGYEPKFDFSAHAVVEKP